jgi:hypothetical protein
VSLGATPVREALDSAVVALTAAGVDTPRLDAEVLLAHVLGVDRAALVIDRDRAVQGAAVRAFQDAVRRRAFDREPVAYITGAKGFRHLELQVDPRVLIPRPETETLVEAAVEVLPQGARVVDVGTGSGAIALALEDERPDLEVTGTDVSEDALEVARATASSTPSSPTRRTSRTVRSWRRRSSVTSRRSPCGRGRTASTCCARSCPRQPRSAPRCLWSRSAPAKQPPSRSSPGARGSAAPSDDAIWRASSAW